jgi:hypothetical protein
VSTKGVERRAVRREGRRFCSELSRISSGVLPNHLRSRFSTRLQRLARFWPTSTSTSPLTLRHSPSPPPHSLVLLNFRTSRLAAAAQQAHPQHLSPDPLSSTPSPARPSHQLEAMFAALLNWLRSLLWNKQADIALIGLQNSGKVRCV